MNLIFHPCSGWPWAALSLFWDFWFFLFAALPDFIPGWKKVVLTVLDDEDGVMADISINYDNGRKSKMLLFAEPRMVDVTDDEDE